MKRILFFALVLCTFSACSSDDATEVDPSKPVGKFDKKPFAWDFQSNTSTGNIYMGDVAPSIESGIKPSDISDRTLELPMSTSFGLNSKSDVYVASMLPDHSIRNKRFDGGIAALRNPIDYIFNFSDPYIEQGVRDGGSIDYVTIKGNAMHSPEYAKHLASPHGSYVNYNMVEYATYADVAKGFESNAQLGQLFAGKVQLNTQNKKLDKVKARLFARLDYVNFHVSMDVSIGGVAKEKVADNSAYIYSLFYGDVAYVAMESEQYSYDALKTAMAKVIEAGHTGTEIDADAQKTLNESSFTLFAMGNGQMSAYFASDATMLRQFFVPHFTSTYFGFPFIVNARYVNSNETLLAKAK